MQADLESSSIRGIIVNFVCRSLLWGTWVFHHFYAIVKGPDKLEEECGQQNASVAKKGGRRGCKDLTVGEGGGGGSRPVDHSGGHDGGGEGVGGKTNNGGTVWYCLDSTLRKPLRLGGTSGLMAHLSSEVREHHGHVFVVDDGVEGAPEATRADAHNSDETAAAATAV